MNAKTLLDQIAATPTAFHAHANVRSALEACGFTETVNGTAVEGKGFFCRNSTALIAYRAPAEYDPQKIAFRIIAVHGDSPALKLKPQTLLPGSAVRLNAQPYGGMIRSSWMDRPLALAGRVTVRTENGLSPRLVYLNRPVAMIPNTPPHLRDMNGLTLDPKTDLVPVFGLQGDPLQAVADELGVTTEQIAGHDLFLTAYGKGVVFGAEEELMSSPRLDDLECVFTCLDGFLCADAPKNTVSIFALFDNEETGSLSYAGAAGTALKDALEAILPDPALRRAAFARSFFVSADNAHALHPNHPELFDPDNAPVINRGVVIKHNAAQLYMSDGYSAAIFAEICRKADVPVQVFANRSDLRGGSTLGNLSEAQVPVRGVDIGAAQWAMHSAYETAGAKDAEYLSRAAEAFYCADISINDTGMNWN